MPVSEMFWGDRYGQLRDPFGVLLGSEPASVPVSGTAAGS